MTAEAAPANAHLQQERQRLAFLLDTAEFEVVHLEGTCKRLFVQPFTAERAATLRSDDLLAERLDAFSARFSRLQDTAGDKLLPCLLACLGEPVSSALDNLDRAARLGLLAESAESWLAARALRNRMVHEYIRSPAALAEAIQAAHEAVPMLTALVGACRRYSQQRHLV